MSPDGSGDARATFQREFNNNVARGFHALVAGISGGGVLFCTHWSLATS